MSSIQVSTFDVDFIERTEKIIDYCCPKKDFLYDFTLLINCLLGLLILPKEYYEKNFLSTNKFNTQINHLPHEIKKIFSNDKVPDYIQDIISSPRKCIIYNRDGEEIKNNMRCYFFTVLSHLRNAISHCHIIPMENNDKDEWEGIVLEDINPETEKTTMKIYLTESEVKILVNFIIEQYKQARSSEYRE